MKDDFAFRQSKRLGHTRQHFDIFAEIAQYGVDQAGGADKVFGTKPKVAEYVPTDLGEEAGRAVASNLKNYPDILALLNRILPGYSDMLETGSESTRALLRGEIPEDVQSQVRRSSAFRSLMGGFGGSGMAKALTARDFGRTSLDMQERGQNAAQRWAALATGVSAPYMVSAAQAGEASFLNKQLAQATEQMKYNVAAAPDPGAAGTFNIQAALGMTAASMGMGAAFGAIGGGGGQGAAGAGGGGSGGWYSGMRQGAQNVQGYQAPASNNYYNSTAAAPPPVQGSFGTGMESQWGPYADTYRWGGGG